MTTEQTLLKVDGQSEITDAGLALSPAALLWRATYLMDSAFLQQLPLAFWLVERLAPAHFVQVGMRDGVSYFGFCQMIDDLQIAAQCNGFGPFDGGKDRVPLALSSYNDQDYGDFSALGAQLDLAQFAAGSIDLLHLNCDPDEQVRADILALCRDKLSPQAVILVHGINTGFAAPEQRAFLRELAGASPVIRFDHGAGMMVILHGNTRDATLNDLAKMPLERPARQRTQQLFARLGLMHSTEFMGQVAAKTQTAPVVMAPTRVQAFEHTQDLVVLALQLEQLTQDKAEMGRINEVEIKALMVEQKRLLSIIASLETGIAARLIDTP